MKEIVCNLSYFSYKHPIYIVDDDNNVLIDTVPTDEIVDKIFTCAVSNNTFHIHLFGNEDYINPFGEELATKIMANYHDSEFSILVN